jgi:UDP-N-acetylglucosamine 4,6-dehydratase
MKYLITGITGFLGRALTQALLDDPATTRVAGFSRDEHKIAAFKASFPQADAWVGDVRDADRMHDALGVQPDVVIHAAAMKRVEACEDNPDEAVKTNIFGTRNVVLACRRANVPKVLVISSDKATSPETCYGKTKAAAEEIALGQNAYRGAGRTRVSVVRYGNVLGSTGSFLDALVRARVSGGAIAITDPDCTRFWWSVESAVGFVRDAIGMMRGAEIFVPKIANARVAELATAIAPQSEQIVTGMRGPEKLHEAMINATEARYTYELPDCYVLLPKQGQPWSPAPPPGAVRVPSGFSYDSSQQPQSVRLEVRDTLPCHASQ